MYHVDCDPSGLDILLFPNEGYREVTRETHARGDASKGRGERGMRDVLFFLPPPLSLARLALFATRKGELAHRLICY